MYICTYVLFRVFGFYFAFFVGGSQRDKQLSHLSFFLLNASCLKGPRSFREMFYILPSTCSRNCSSEGMVPPTFAFHSWFIFFPVSCIFSHELFTACAIMITAEFFCWALDLDCFYKYFFSFLFFIFLFKIELTI